MNWYMKWYMNWYMKWEVSHLSTTKFVLNTSASLNKKAAVSPIGYSWWSLIHSQPCGLGNLHIDLVFTHTGALIFIQSPLAKNKTFVHNTKVQNKV